MEMNENDLGKVSGGTAVETKEGKWILMPPHAKTFDTKDAAEKAEKEFMEKHNHRHCGNGHHRGGKHGGCTPPMAHPPQEGPKHE
jgi:hypothetical protein